jgi:hypothetical protein
MARGGYIKCDGNRFSSSRFVTAQMLQTSQRTGRIGKIRGGVFLVKLIRFYGDLLSAKTSVMTSCIFNLTALEALGRALRVRAKAPLCGVE